MTKKSDKIPVFLKFYRFSCTYFEKSPYLCSRFQAIGM